jgi:hypothetical protein
VQKILTGSLFQLYAQYMRLSTKMTSNVMHGAESSLKNASTKTPKKMFKEEVNELLSHFPGNVIISAKIPIETADANMEHSMIM